MTETEKCPMRKGKIISASIRFIIARKHGTALRTILVGKWKSDHQACHNLLKNKRNADIIYL